MPQAINLKIAGLYTAPNDFSGVPQGALDVADDVVIDQSGLAEPRRGYSAVTGTLPLSSDRTKQFTNFQAKQVIAYSGTSLAYYTGSAWSTYSGTFNPPDATLAQVRFFEANQNLFISTSTGVFKLDTVTGTPARAGTPKGLDLQLSLTGASGFLTTNIQATTTATTTNTSANLTLIGSLGNIAVGQFVQGTNIPSGTTVSSITQSAQVLIATGTTTAGSTSMTAVPSNTGLVANVLISGAGILAGTRIVSISGAGPYTVTMSQSAIQANTGATYTFSTDPVITMSANATGSGSVAVSFGLGTQVGYRMLWGIVDANQNTLRGVPSQFNSITNNTGITANVQVTSSIPAGITTAHFFEIYRSAQTASSTATPLDDEQLVYTGNPNSTDLSNGYIQVTDITPDSLKGAYLYTGISQQGISQANERPPYCKDFCAFKNYAFYANVRFQQALNLTILAVGSPNGVQSGDTLTLGGVVFTADSSENTATGHFQVFTAGTPAQNIANTANSLIKVINRYASNTAVYAYLLSGPTDLPGQMLIQEQGNTGTVFYAVASAHGSAYSPALPTSGTTIASTQSSYKNGIIVSKLNEPESSPHSNLLFAGSASKEILRIIPLRDYIVILKQDGIFRLSGLTLQTFLISPFDLTSKLLAPNTAISLSNEVWGLFDQGVCSVSDTGVNVRSRPIEDKIRSLIGTALSTVKTVSFAVGYETDRKYILGMPATSGDTVAQQEFIFSTFTNAWTRWTRRCTAGFVDPTVDQLYFGNSDNSISIENKTDTYTDYVDEPFAITIVSSSQYSVTVNSVIGVTVGDILYQSASVASVITAIDPLNLIFTVQDLLTWTNGAAQIFPAINSVIQWKPAAGNPMYNNPAYSNPAFMYQFSEGAIIFKRTRFNSATMSFYSDIDQSFEDVPLTGFAIATWGTFPWGGQNWGGVNRPKSIRFLVPQNKQMCSQLSPKFTVRNGYSNWALQGVSLSVDTVSQEIA